MVGDLRRGGAAARPAGQRGSRSSTATGRPRRRLPAPAGRQRRTAARAVASCLVPGPRVDQGAVQHLRAVLPAPRRRDALGRGAGPGRGLGFLAVFRDATGTPRRWPRCRGGRPAHGWTGSTRSRVVVVGTSFGGYLALAARHRVRARPLRGVVDIAGPYDLRAFDELQPVTRDGFRDFVGAADRGGGTRPARRRHRSTASSTGSAAPVLVVHGEQDPIIDVIGTRTGSSPPSATVPPYGWSRPATTRATTWPPPCGRSSPTGPLTGWTGWRCSSDRPDEQRASAPSGSTTWAASATACRCCARATPLYVGHFGPSGVGTSILDASDPTDLRLVRQWMAPARQPHPQGPGRRRAAAGQPRAVPRRRPVQRRHGRLRPGRPASTRSRSAGSTRPARACTGSSGPAAATPTSRRSPTGIDDRIWVVVDMSDPRHPVEAGRWWWPGQWTAAASSPPGPRASASPRTTRWSTATRAYLGYGDAGLVVLDISDVAKPAQLANLTWEHVGDTHTCLPLPGRDLLVVTDEVVTEGRAGEPHDIRVVDVSDPADPRVVSVLPGAAGRVLRPRAALRPAQPAREPAGLLPQRARWSSRRASTPGCGSTTCATPSTPSRSRTGCRRPRTARRRPQINDLFVGRRARHLGDRPGQRRRLRPGARRAPRRLMTELAL